MTAFRLTGIRVCLLAALLLGHVPVAKTQDAGIEVDTRVDRRAIRLGDPAVVTVAVTIPQGPSMDATAHWPDTLPHFEWLAPPGADTSFSAGRWRIAFSRSFTSFDSGRWTLPHFAFVIGGRTVRSDTVGIHVGTVPLAGDDYRDIGDILEAETTPEGMPPFGYAALAALLLIGLTAWLYWRKRRPDPGLPLAAIPPAEAYDEAMKGLDRLLDEVPSGADAARAFHTSLYSLFRAYLRDAHGWQASSLTTGDLVALLSRHGPDRPLLTRLAASLRMSDAVRFARHVPPAGDSRNCASDIRSYIRFLHESSPNR